MTEEEIAKAIKFLKPNSGFYFTETDYSTIQWENLEGNAPTFQELEVALEQIKEAEAQKEATKAAEKAAAEAKLAALGLTSDDLRALGL